MIDASESPIEPPKKTKIFLFKQKETTYLLDALKSDSSDIKIAAVSGDMHSINLVNFRLLHMFGYMLMPILIKG